MPPGGRFYRRTSPALVGAPMPRMELQRTITEDKCQNGSRLSAVLGGRSPPVSRARAGTAGAVTAWWISGVHKGRQPTRLI